MNPTTHTTIRGRTALLLALAFLWAGTGLYAQTDTIAGIVNRYTRVLTICNGALYVKNPTGFHKGDKVLIIQMKGAEINTGDSSAFGDILNYHNAGNYELAELAQVNGSTLVPKYRLVRQYDIDGLVQVIRVPSYANVLVSGTLTAKAWDGETGGVLALIASGTVTLNADIDVSGKGFRGDVRSGGLTSFDGATGWRFVDTSTSGAYKGEGITEFVAAMHAGRGKLANGGGGGNSRGSGGGGGGNGGHGGRGGYQSSTYDSLAIGGIGGDSLAYDTTNRKVFLGGAGGASGYEDTDPPYAGSAGGGIVLLSIDSLVSNSHSVVAKGADNVLHDSTNAYVGAGGGGAGGVILAEIGTIVDSLRANVAGGKGGNAQSLIHCYGPGGGGGGGCVWFNTATQPSRASPNISPGVGGHAMSAQCNGTPYGVTPASAGTVRTSLQIPTGTIPR